MVNRLLSAIVVLALFLIGCKKDGGGIGEMNKDDAAFGGYTTHFLEALWKLDPDRATRTGYHQYDSLLIVPNNSHRDKMVSFAKVETDSLLHYDPNTLSDANKIDYQLIQNEVQQMQ